MTRMQQADLGVIKDIPGYKVILKTVLRCQIQQLVEQLAAHTDEESVILTASVSDGTLCHLGSESGKCFLEDHDDVKSQFLGFCLKRQQQKRADTLNDTVQNFTDRFSKHQPYTMPPHMYSQRPLQSRPGGPLSMPRGAGIRHDPYARSRPVRQQSPQTVGRSPVASRMAMALNSDYMKYEHETEPNDGSESDEGTAGSDGLQTSTPFASQGSSPRQTSMDPQLELKPSQGLSVRQTSMDPQLEFKPSQGVSARQAFTDSQLELKPSQALSARQAFTDSHLELKPSQGSSARQAFTDSHLELKSEVCDKTRTSEPDPENIPKENFDSTSDTENDNKNSFSRLVPSDGHAKEGENCETPGPSGEPGASDSSSSVKMETSSNAGSDVEGTGSETGHGGSHEMWMPESFGYDPPGGSGNQADYPLDQEYKSQAMKTKKEYKCDRCGKSYRLKSRLKYHVLNIHLQETDRSVCLICKLRCSSVNNLKLHQRNVHMGEKQERCENCGKRFLSKRDLAEHKRQFHGDEKLKCDKCQLEFAYARNLNRHKLHCGQQVEKCFECDLCDRKYQTERALKAHVQVKHTENQFICQLCGKSFGIKYSLTRHLKHCSQK